MPPKTRTRKSLPSTQQSTLSFNNKSTKVTKSSTSQPDKKTASKLHEITRDEIVDHISEPEAESQATQIKAESEAEKEKQVTSTTDDENEAEVTFRPRSRKNRISTGSTASKEEHASLESAIAAAAKIKDTQIKKYWKAEEDARIAPRVHQEGLPVHEKILRHFDLSSQYGPCIGIPRLNRWKRAYTLHMNPPVEVLAVLLKEEVKGVERGDKMKGGEARQCGRLAYIDELAGGKVVLVE